MIKVLGKSFSIVSAVVNRAPVAVPLADLAMLTGLNKTTCSRIVRDLLDAGYLTQVSRQSGFIPGPALLALGMRAAESTPLVRAGLPIVHDLAEITGQMASLVVLHEGRRCILASRNCDASMRYEPHASICINTMDTSTGLVLLAHAAPVEQEKARRLMKGRDTPLLQALQGRKSFEALMAKIRADGGIVYKGSLFPKQIAVGWPVYENGNVVAAIGFFGRRNKDSKKWIQQVVDHAATLSRNLSQITALG